MRYDPQCEGAICISLVVRFACRFEQTMRIQNDICLYRLLSEETQNLVKIMPESWLDFSSDLIHFFVFFKVLCCVVLNLHGCVGF